MLTNDIKTNQNLLEQMSGIKFFALEDTNGFFAVLPPFIYCLFKEQYVHNLSVGTC